MNLIQDAFAQLGESSLPTNEFYRFRYGRDDTLDEDDRELLLAYASMALLAAELREIRAASPLSDLINKVALFEQQHFLGRNIFEAEYRIAQAIPTGLIEALEQGEPVLRQLDDTIVHEWTTKVGKRLLQALAEFLRTRPAAHNKLCGADGLRAHLEKGRDEKDLAVALLGMLCSFLGLSAGVAGFAALAAVVFVRRRLNSLCPHIQETGQGPAETTTP